MSHKLTETPCIGICSTIYGDNVCRGCKRFYDEIIEWNTYDRDKKLTILSRLNYLTTHVMERYVDVFDASKLRHKCETYNIKIRPNFSPLTWAYNLLREAADEIHNLKQYGIQIKKEFSEINPAELIKRIDDELFARSEDAFTATTT